MKAKINFTFLLCFFHFFYVIAQNPDLIENFSIDQTNNIIQQENFGIANGKVTTGIRYDDIIGVNGLWAPPFVSSDFLVKAYVNGNSISNSNYTWYPFYINKSGIISSNINISSKTILSSDNRTGIVSLTFKNSSNQTVVLPLSFNVQSPTLNNYSSDTYWGFGRPLSTNSTNSKITGNLYFDQLFVFNGFSASDNLFAASENTVYWQYENQLRRGTITNGSLSIDQSFVFNGFTTSDRLFAASGNTVYWQCGNQLRRGTITNGSLSIDQSFIFNGFTTSDRLFAALGNTVYWQCGNQLRRGTITNGSLSIDQTFLFDGYSSTDNLFAASGNTVYWQCANQLRRGLVSTGSSLNFEQGLQSVVVSTDKNYIWDSNSQSFSGTISIPALSEAKAYLVFSIGPTLNALTQCNDAINNPESIITNSHNAYNQKVNALYQKLPVLESNNLSLKHFYDRSLVPFLLNRWEVEDVFKLNPYYSTGSIKGGCIGEYLWNFGETMEIMSVYDPAATKAHIKQLLTTGVQRGFGFCPINGSMLEPNYFYPINQEKIIGLTYNYVKNTGDISFLNESVGSSTVLDEILSQALFFDNLSLPVSLIDYNTCDPQHAGGASHLELRSETYIYRFIMPDLNGRRYLNYEYAAQLSLMAGKPRLDLLQRAESLKTVLKNELWDSSNKWFKFQDTRTGIKENRYTVQMFYLLNSDVLDKEQQDGLISHLNENEFLSTYGLHSLAKGDLAYDPNDVDNGGPGSCTSFPLNIAKSLYLSGYALKADDILRRILWWGEKMPYWGDSFYADQQDYRRNTPLQCTIDGVTGAQCIIFGMFGISPRFDGTIKINPTCPSFASQISLKGIKILNQIFDVIINNGTYEVKYNNTSISAAIGQPVIIKNNSLTLESNSKLVCQGDLTSGLLNTSHVYKGFSTSDRLFTSMANCYYWQSDNQLRRGIITNDILSIDQSFAYDNFSLTDRLFAAQDNVAYWQSDNQVRRGTVVERNLNIDPTFWYNGFSSSDRLFAISGNYVYWQSNNQLRRGIVTSGSLAIDQSFSFNGFSSSDYLFAANANTIYWQSGNQIRSGTITNGSLSIDQQFVYNNFSPSNSLFASNNNSLYWQTHTTQLKNAKIIDEDVNFDNKQSSSLGQNIPNPFSHITEIEYSLLEDVNNAELYIYNTNGILIKSIKLPIKNGKTVIKISREGLNSGLYFYKLIADGKEIGSKSMIITQ
jgi:hypothetical protein